MNRTVMSGSVPAPLQSTCPHSTYCVKDLLALPAVDVDNCTYLQLNKTRFKQWWMWPVDGDRAEPPDSFHLNIFLNVKSRSFF